MPKFVLLIQAILLSTSPSNLTVNVLSLNVTPNTLFSLIKSSALTVNLYSVVIAGYATLPAISPVSESIVIRWEQHY